MLRLRLNSHQLEIALAVKEGDALTLHPYWNESSGPSLKLPERPICQGIKKGPGSQTGIRFCVKKGTWLDAAWFIFPETTQAMTVDEMKREYQVAFQTALGRSCDDREPTDEQKQSARAEAIEHVKRCQASETQQNPK